MNFPSYDPEAQVLIAPSILAADFSNLASDIAKVEEEADFLHIDVMDGQFVPNISFGTPIMESIRPKSKLPFDVHLMIEAPERYFEAFAAAGADGISVHVETSPHLHRSIQAIHDLGLSAGVVLNPATPLSTIEEILPFVDLVLLMSVNPGFGGQRYIPETTDKIRRLREMIRQTGKSIHIQVDGGVSADNVRELWNAGANNLVAGSAVFKAEDPAEEIRKMKAACVH